MRQSIGTTWAKDDSYPGHDVRMAPTRLVSTKAACSFPSTVSSTSTKKMSPNFKDLVSKVKKPFTRSRLPSRAPTPVTDNPPVDPTQGGNDEAVFSTSCSSNALIVGLSGRL